jgi:hypothetical protein
VGGVAWRRGTVKSKKKKQQRTGSMEAVESFVRLVNGYLVANADRVRMAYDSGSGWEIWLHVELFMYIRQQLPNANIRREARVYPTYGPRADFNFEGVTVEVKTEGETQKGETFANGVFEDMGKIEEQDNYALVIGICCTRAAAQQLGDLTTAQLPPITLNGQTVYFGWEASEAV